MNGQQRIPQGDSGTGIADERGAGKRRTSGKRRRQPYSWLGAGALSLGFSAALATGSGIAHADTGADATDGSGGPAANASRSDSSSAGRSARGHRTGPSNDDTVAEGPAGKSSRSTGGTARTAGRATESADSDGRRVPLSVPRPASAVRSELADHISANAAPVNVADSLRATTAVPQQTPTGFGQPPAPTATTVGGPAVMPALAGLATPTPTPTPAAAALRTLPQIAAPAQTILRALGLFPGGPGAPIANPIGELLWGLFRRTESATQIIPAATAATTSAPTAAYKVVSNWGSGHTAEIAVTAGSANLSGWTVEFDTPAQIVNIWNGQITSRTGNHYVISNMSYNGQVAAGQTTTFGYQASPGAPGSAPTNITVNGVPVGTATPPVVTPPSVSIADVSVSEGNSGTTNANFTVTLSKTATDPVTVGYSTANGTATAGTDFTARSGTLTFAPGVTAQTVTVAVTGDTAVESDETFTVALANPSGATLSRATATATIKNDDVAAPVPSQGAATVNYAVTNDWGSGHNAAMTVTAGQSNLTNWTVEFDSPAKIVNIWNAQITSHVGDHYVITNMPYNGRVAAGRSTSFGFQATPGAIASAPTNMTVNGVAVATPTTPPTAPAISIADLSVGEGNGGGNDAHFMFAVTMDKASDTPVTVKYATSNGTATAGADYQSAAGTLTFAPGVTAQTVHVDIVGDTAVEPNETFKVTLSDPAGGTISRAVATGTIVNDDTSTPTTTPGLSISDASATEPGGSGMAAGYLRTSGNQIIDSQGNPVQLASVNWFGAEGTNLAPHGLWTRNYKDMIDQMSDQGFNTIRLPYSSEMLHTTAQPNGIDFYQNPDLQGLNAIQVMDKVVEYAGEKGMRVVLDHHRSTAGAGTSENGLWYNAQYTEDQWVADWQMLADHYKGNPTVIGFDLHNEPYNGTWGGGGANDWARAAERAGNAALAVNPDLLIFVEGVGSYQGQNYWWGGNLMGVRDRPIVLDVPNRVVYSPHDYPNSVWPQPWFQTANFGADLPNVFRQAWGYIYEENIAPIWVGEFGTKLQDPKDVIWFEAITSYLSGDFDNNGTIDIPAGTEDMSWAYWSWNPNSGDTGGILADDWRTVNENKMDYLTPIQYTGGSGTSLSSFTVTLAAPSSQTVTVQYATMNGTATAGADYAASSGTLTFAPGETQKTIAVAVKSDSLTEGTENFHVMLSNPTGATLTDAMGMGTITDRPTDGTTPGSTTGGGTQTPTDPEPTDPGPTDPTDHSGHTPTPGDTGQYIDLATLGSSNGSSHTGHDAFQGGRTAITSEALVAYNNLRHFAGLAPSTLEDVGRWAFDNRMTNNTQAWGNDLQGVGMYYAMQGAKVGWIADDKYNPQIIADIQRTARLGSAADVMAMVDQYGHPGYGDYLRANAGYETAFINTLKMEPHYAGWMHDRAHGRLTIEGIATAHDVNHLTVLSHDQTKPFMNDTWDWPQWAALSVSNKGVIEYFQSMVTLGDPKGTNLNSLNGPIAL
ncbi:MAG TPA: cellulase family glycosylhydrolase [Mycobacterium sp.]|nr:cellulase family glycosylhydrolase [Mycobacterium sp.]HQE16098.1 cellulase family glycosylhydrolase [Mycobacterium sp.]